MRINAVYLTLVLCIGLSLIQCKSVCGQIFSKNTDLYLLNNYLKELGYSPIGFAPFEVTQQQLLNYYYQQSVSDINHKITTKQFADKNGAISLDNLPTVVAVDTLVEQYLFQELFKIFDATFRQIDSASKAVSSQKSWERSQIQSDRLKRSKKFVTIANLENYISKVNNPDSLIKLYEILLARMYFPQQNEDGYYKYSYYSHKLIRLCKLRGNKIKERDALLLLAFQIQNATEDFYVLEKSLVFYIRAFEISKELGRCSDNYFDKCNILRTLISILHTSREFKQRTNLVWNDYRMLGEVIHLLMTDLLKSNCKKDVANFTETDRAFLAYIISDLRDFKSSNRLYLLSAVNAHNKKDYKTFGEATYQLGKNYLKSVNVNSDEDIKNVLIKYDKVWNFIIQTEFGANFHGFNGNYRWAEKNYYLFQKACEWRQQLNKNISQEYVIRILNNSVFLLNKACNIIDSIGCNMYIGCDLYLKKKEEWRAETANYLDRYIISINEPKYHAWMADSTYSIDSMYNSLLQYTIRTKSTYGYEFLNRASGYYVNNPYWNYEKMVKGELQELTDELKDAKDELESIKNKEIELKSDSIKAERIRTLQLKNKVLEQQNRILNEEQSAKAFRDNIFTIILTAALLTVILWVYFDRKRIKKINEEQIKRLSIESEFAMAQNKLTFQRQNPHIESNLKSLVTSISIDEKLTNVEKMSFFDDVYNPYLDSIVELQKQVLVGIKTEIQNLQLYNHLTSYLKQIQLEVQLENEIECMVPPLILQPLLENAIEHAFIGISHAPVVSINVREELDYFKICFIDNGVGIRDDFKRGNGISLIEERLAIYNRFYNKMLFSSLYIEPRRGNGTNGSVFTFKVFKNER